MTFHSGAISILTCAVIGISSVGAEAPQGRAATVEKLPMTGLPPAKIFPGLCLVKYRVSTMSP